MEVDSLVHEADLGETLDDGRLAALKACLRLTIACSRLLTLVTATRGLTKTGATTATKTFLLEKAAS